MSVDLSQVDNLQTVENTCASGNDNQGADESVLVLEDVSFTQAKAAELASWRNNGVFVETEDTGQKCVSTRWVCSLKETPTGIVPKARLVA